MSGERYNHAPTLPFLEEKEANRRASVDLSSLGMTGKHSTFNSLDAYFIFV